MLPRINQGVITFLLVVISILEGQSTAIFEVENNCLTHATLFLDTKCPFLEPGDRKCARPDPRQSVELEQSHRLLR